MALDRALHGSLGLHHKRSAEHTRHDHLTAILGYTQLLQRRITLCPNLTPSERELLLQEFAVIEQSAYVLQRDPASPPSPTDES